MQRLDDLLEALSAASELGTSKQVRKIENRIREHFQEHLQEEEPEPVVRRTGPIWRAKRWGVLYQLEAHRDLAAGEVVGLSVNSIDPPTGVFMGTRDLADDDEIGVQAVNPIDGGTQGLFQIAYL